MPQNAFFLWTRDLLVSQKMTQRLFFSTLHPLSVVVSATATVLAFVLLCSSRFGFHCHTWCEAMPTQKSAWKWRFNLLWLLVRKNTKGIHLCKPALLNRPIGQQKLIAVLVDHAKSNGATVRHITVRDGMHLMGLTVLPFPCWFRDAGEEECLWVMFCMLIFYLCFSYPVLKLYLILMYWEFL